MTNEELVKQIQLGINTCDYMEQLYIQNKGFIATVVRKYRYACQSDYNSTPIIEMDELMHEAYFGIVKAAEQYDPSQGVLFLSYASHWINQAVKRYLDNSGRVIRVPVHAQEKIYKYNQATAFYLSKYNRQPAKREYASWIGISIVGVDKLENFMFQRTIQSLDAPIPGNDNDSISIGDAVPAESDVEYDVVEKVAAVQLHEELWDIVAQVLKDERKICIFRLRYINNMTMEQIGEQMHVHRTAIDQTLRAGIKMLQHNSRTRNLGEELGIWSRELPIDASRVKRCSIEGKLDYLNKKEMNYAINMGWINIDLQKNKYQSL